MKRFWTYFFTTIVILVVAFFLVSLIMASVHDVTIVAEWEDWLEKLNIIKENAEPVVETAKIMFMRAA